MSALARLATAKAAYQAQLTIVAEQAHRDIVKPLCDKWGVSFQTGMGMWSFYAPANSPRAPQSPIYTSDFVPASQANEQDRVYLNHGLPDEFWVAFQRVTAELGALDDEHEMFVATYLSSYEA